MKVETISFEELAEGLYLEEKTVRRRLYKLLDFLGIHQDEFKNEKGGLEFDKELAEYIRWFISELDTPYLKNTLLKKETTYEEAREFHDQLLQKAEEFNEPLRSQAIKLAEDAMMYKVNSLYDETMKRVNKAVSIVNQLPVKKRVEVIKSLHEPLDNWIEELECLLEETDQGA
ncbi:DNA-binding Lrp family transcriptional regulator [Desulfitispora alkaliphila]|uniref:hypothetical protein n=1 Tax=Desulfitispora alkaliphila TaxID=622674 RepID=UPI003D1E9786